MSKKSKFAAAMAVALAVGTLVPTSAGAAVECRVVQMKTGGATEWGTVMDIEQVQIEGHLQTVYYGSFVRDGHQRAALWFGLDDEPFVIPTGFDDDVAYELTSTGLVNGHGYDAATDTGVPWVYNIATGELTRVPTDSGDWVRRINSTGALTGQGSRGTDNFWHFEATAWDHFTGRPEQLQETGSFSTSYAINDLGERAGARGKSRYGGWQPIMWDAQGRAHEVAAFGNSSLVRGIAETGQMSGFTGSSDPTKSYFQPAFWPSRGSVLGLGVLADAGLNGDAFGMDDTGWLGGGQDRAGDPFTGDPNGIASYSFLWTGPEMTGTVRILPSIWSVDNDVSDWRQWISVAPAHAVSRALDQVGAGSQTGFATDADGFTYWVGAPTVYVNASTCGQVVPTTQSPSLAGPPPAHNTIEKLPPGLRGNGFIRQMLRDRP
jgi:hypothetical protein